MKPFDLVVRGDMVTSQGVEPDRQIAIRDGRICSIHQGNEHLESGEALDVRGKLVFPGLVDSHVHCCSNPDEGIANTTRSALAGGITTVIDMPFDTGEIVSNDTVLERKISLVGKEALTDVALLGTIPKNGDISAVPAMLKLGMCGIKLSVTESDPKRFPRISDDILQNILPVFATYAIPVGFHAENDEIVRANMVTFESRGEHNIEHHILSRPPLSEYLEIVKLLEFTAYSGVQLHMNHLTLPRSVDHGVAYRKAGCNITIETCPHYLALDREDSIRLGMRSRLNPPLRDADAVSGLWDRLLAGDIDTLASDHAPWPLAKKTGDNVFKNACGSPSVETMLPVMFFEAVVRRKANPALLCRLMATNPARRYGLDHCKGSIASGKDADLVIVDPNAKWEIHADELHAAAGWTLYEGKKVQGRVTATIARGQIAFDGKNVLRKVGEGKYLPRHTASQTTCPS